MTETPLADYVQHQMALMGIGIMLGVPVGLAFVMVLNGIEWLVKRIFSR